MQGCGIAALGFCRACPFASILAYLHSLGEVGIQISGRRDGRQKCKRQSNAARISAGWPSLCLTSLHSRCTSQACDVHI